MNAKTRVLSTETTRRNEKTEMAFTPGPWEVVELADGRLEVRTCLDGDSRDDGSHFIVGGETVAEITDVDCDIYNADLIAAAPEMFEALEPLDRALAELEQYAPNEADTIKLSDLRGFLTVANLRKARAALAKARGEA